MSGGLDKQPPGAKEGEQPNGENEVQVTEEEEESGDEKRHEEKDDDDDTDDDDTEDDDTEDDDTETETDDDEDIEWPHLLDLTSSDWVAVEALMVKEIKRLDKLELDQTTTPPPEKKRKREE